MQGCTQQQTRQSLQGVSARDAASGRDGLHLQLVLVRFPCKAFSSHTATIDNNRRTLLLCISTPVVST